jgi:hypothetical protein
MDRAFLLSTDFLRPQKIRTASLANQANLKITLSPS